MRLIDADEAIEQIQENLEQLGDYYTVEDVIADVNTMPTVDAVQVVRCERCRYWHRYSSNSRKGRCSGMILYLNGELETPEDFFCADGEER